MHKSLKVLILFERILTMIRKGVTMDARARSFSSHMWHAVLVVILLNFVRGFGAPELRYATYSEDYNRLELEFFNSLVDSLEDSSATITLSVDEGATQIVLNNWIPNTAEFVDDSVIWIDLSPEQATTLEQWPTLYYLKVAISAGAFSDTGGANSAVSYSDGVYVLFEYGYEAPLLTAASYDAGFNQLQLRFDQPVLDVSFESFSSVQLSTDGGATVQNLQTPLNVVSAVQQNDSLLVLWLPGDDALQLESSLSANVCLSIAVDSAMVTNSPLQPSLPLRFMDRREVQVTSSGSGPMVTEAWYDADYNQLHLSFDQLLADSTANDSASIVLSTDWGNLDTLTVTIPLQTATGVTANDSAMTIALLPQQAQRLESMAGVDQNLLISLSQSPLVSSSALEPNVAFGFGQNIPVRVERFSGGPLLHRARYESDYKRIELAFDQPVQDNTVNENALVGVSTDNGSTATVTLLTPLHWFTGTTADDSLLFIRLDSTQLNSIDTLTGMGSSLEISLDSYFVNSFLNEPNLYIDFTHDVSVEADSGIDGPLVLHAAYHEDFNTLEILFDRPVVDSSFDTRAVIKFTNNKYSITLTPPFVVSTGYQSNDNFIQIQLNPADAQQLEGWDWHADIALEVSEGLFSDSSAALSKGLLASDGMIISYYEGMGSVVLVSAQYNSGFNRLRLVFESPVDDNSFITEQAISLSVDGGGTNTVYVTAPMSMITGQFKDDDTVFLQLSASTAGTVESWPNVQTDLQIQINQDFIYDFN